VQNFAANFIEIEQTLLELFRFLQSTFANFFEHLVFSPGALSFVPQTRRAHSSLFCALAEQAQTRSARSSSAQRHNRPSKNSPQFNGTLIQNVYVWNQMLTCEALKNILSILKSYVIWRI